MAAMNFPSSPSDGATFISDGGVTYIYNSAEGKWKTLLITADDALPLTGGGITGNLTVSGTVGVGVTDPGYELEVGGSSNVQVAITANDNAGNSQLYFGDPDNDDSGALIYRHADDSLAFEVNSGEKLRIDSSGRVGIGTSLPGAPLSFADSNAFKIQFNGNAANYYGISKLAGGGSLGDGEFKFTAGNVTAGAFTFSSAGSEKVRIDSSGNVGIGADSLDSLSARTSIGYRSLRVQNANITAAGGSYAIFGVNYYQDTAGTLKYIDAGYSGRIDTWGDSIQFHLSNGAAADDNISGSERMRIDSSGRLLVGTSTSSSADSYIQSVRTSGQSNALVESKELADSQITSYIASARRSGGSFRYTELGLFKHSGITETCSYLRLQSTDGAANYFWTDDSDQFRISTNAAHIGTTSGTVVGTQTSDERIKNILGSVDYGLDTIKQIEPVRFALKSDPDTEKIGFIAQQVQPLIPQSVFDTGEHIEGEPEDAPTKLGMEYVALIPVLVNAIKELSAEVDALKAQLS